MDERDPAKRGRVSDMNPRHEATTAPIARTPTPDAMLEAELQAQIGRQLRAVYDEVVNEAVPDRFLRLLEELERKQTERP
jgi:hypothetical protein